MELELIRIEVADHVALVTMDAPPVNAQNAQFNNEMAYAMDTISDRNDIRSVVLTGAGKVFSAGADIKARSHMGDVGQKWQHSRRARECYHSIRECAKPVVGAINGAALGAGLAVASSCDILVAAEEASLGLPEIDVGLLGGGRHAQRLFGHSTLRRMMLTGYRVPGPELYRLGIVGSLCATRTSRCGGAQDCLKPLPPKARRRSAFAKQSLNVIEDLSLRDGYRYEQNMTAQLSTHPDSKEAMQAFIEKRQPKFQD